MMNQEQNDLITRIGPNTPCGRLMRNYWQPAALTAELAGPRPIKAVRLLGEEFVLFRDEAGRLGLMDRDCPHRGADLAFGRLENGGLRCAFHGWLFDVEGKCLETPAEPGELSAVSEHPSARLSGRRAERNPLGLSWRRRTASFPRDRLLCRA